MTDRTSQFEIAVHDFDTALLPAHARRVGTDEFRTAVTDVLRKEYESFGGRVQIVVSDEFIRVSWSSPVDDPVEAAVAHLQRGNYEKGISQLKSLQRQWPDDATIPYNLGMALSETGQLVEAEQVLRKAIDLEPSHTNAWVALGVALQRQKKTDEAIDVLIQAAKDDPDNPWAQRNLGACLFEVGKLADAKDHLKRSTELNPADQQAWFGLGQCCEALDEEENADVAYQTVIELDTFPHITELAKRQRSAIGQAEMRRRGGDVRFDAVMYCLAALQHFSQMSEFEVRNATFEVAMRGQRGFDFNDPTQKYEFKNLPGKFSGLQALSYMYVGFKQIAPSQDIGFDLAKEFKAAQEMFNRKD